MSFIKPTPYLPLFVLIVLLPVFSETVYSPVLPSIASAFNVKVAIAEFTVTIYLAGVGFGTLFWGKVSDKIGRRFCVLCGFSIYVLGTFFCLSAPFIELFMLGRLTQALGGAAGVVLSQAMTMDVFPPKDRGKIFSAIGGVLAFLPAIGPIVGGFIVELFNWQIIFVVLGMLGILCWVILFFYLPETLPKSHRYDPSLLLVARRMMSDSRVMYYALLVGILNGITFSYHTEGPFYIIQFLGFKPSTYGKSFVAMAFMGALGGYLSARFQARFSAFFILRYGVFCAFLGTCLFAVPLVAIFLGWEPPLFILGITIFCMMIISFGRTVVTSNALFLGLEEYQDVMGTAYALFGFFYYCVISLTSFGIGLLHSGTLLTMPIYFIVMGFAVLKVLGLLSRSQKNEPLVQQEARPS
jgi:Bcr/CflA subfamily drug resistance transporter